MVAYSRAPRAWCRFIASILSAALILSSPGLPAYEAFAANIAHVPTKVGTPGIQAGAGAAVGAFSLGSGSMIQNSVSVSLTGSLPGVPGALPSVSVQSARSASVQAPAAAHSAAAAAPVSASLAAPVRTASRAAAPVAPAKAAPAAASKSAATALKSSPISAAAAAPTRGPSKGSMGRLTSAVSALPGMLRLNGSALKSEAGRVFEGGAARASGASVFAGPSGARKSGLVRRAGADEAKTEVPAAVRSRTARPKAWLSKRYKPILEVGIFAGYAAGLAFFALTFQATGGLSILALPAGVIGGVFLGDRLARGSAEKVLERYRERLEALPGVHGIGVIQEEGSKKIAVYYRSEKAVDRYSRALPEMIDGYDAVIRVKGREAPVKAEPAKAKPKKPAKPARPKAWLSKRYKPILEAGIILGFSVGLFGFVGLYGLVGKGILGGLAATLLPAGVIAGVLIGDRLARGSAEKVMERYRERLMSLPGVRGLDVIRTEDGRKAIGVYYDSEAALARHSLALPELIDGYDAVPRVLGETSGGAVDAGGIQTQAFGLARLLPVAARGMTSRGTASWLSRRSEPVAQASVFLGVSLSLAAAMLLSGAMGEAALALLPVGLVAGSLATAAGKSPRRPRAWLNDRYEPILKAGIYTGFALGTVAFFLLYNATGGLSVLLLPGGVLAGTFAGDRLGRGSVEKVISRYSDRLMDLPGVRGLGVTRKDGRRVIAVYYGSEAEMAAHSSALPELIDGYEAVPLIAEVEALETVRLPLDSLDGVSFQSVMAAMPAGRFLSFPLVSAAVVQRAGEADAEEPKLKPGDVLFYTQTKETIDRHLDGFLKDNSGWWARVTGKQRLVEMAVSAFRQELRAGRKPDFEITVKEDGVKKYLRGPNGETMAEIMWVQLKGTTGLTEVELQRYLAIARKIR